MVGVAGFEPAASSSRSQVHSFSCWAFMGAGLVSLSANVRRSPCRDVAIVTQLVTRLVGRAGGWLPGGYSVAAPPSPRRPCISPRGEGAPRYLGVDVHWHCRRPRRKQCRWRRCLRRHPSAVCECRLVRLAVLAGACPRGARQRGRRFPYRPSPGTMSPPRRRTPGLAHRAPRRRRRCPGGTTGSHSYRKRNSVGAGQTAAERSRTQLTTGRRGAVSHSPSNKSGVGVRKRTTTWVGGGRI